MMQHKLTVLLNLCLPFMVCAQPALLTPEHAVQMAIKNNLPAKISENNQNLAKQLKTWGNAGFLPSLQLNSGYTLQNSNLKQEYSNGMVVDRKGVGSNSLQAALNFQWVLFDGGQMFNNWNILGEAAKQAGLNYRNLAEELAASTLISYFEIVQYKQELKAYNSGLETAEQQVLVSRTKSESGTGTRQELLQSLVDLSKWKSLIISQKSKISTAQIRFSELLSLPANTEFLFVDSLPEFYNISVKDIGENDLTNNTSLLIAESNMQTARLTVKGYQSDRYPALFLNSGYAFGRSTSQGGFALYNKSFGPNIGLGLSWSLFNGGRLNSSIFQAKTVLKNTELTYANTELTVKAELKIASTERANQQELKKLQVENMAAAYESMELALERFKIGKSDLVNLKEAQRSFMESVSSLSNASLLLLKSEIELLRLSGRLIR